MANVYGTPQYWEYRKKWNQVEDGAEWVLVETQASCSGAYQWKYDGYCQKDEVAHYDDTTYPKLIRLRWELTILREGKELYSCKEIYRQGRPPLHFYTYEGNDYLLFHKDDLYGYTILNLDTLEEHNYFPDQVLDGKDESFIIVDAHLWGDLLLLYGCYWACPFVCCVLNLKTYKTYFLGDRGIDDNGLRIQGDVLTVFYYDEELPESETFSYSQVSGWVAASETCEM